MEWQSSTTIASQTWPGVDLIINRMTFARRLELLRQVRELAVRLEYFEAGRDERNRIEASLLGAELDELYIRWGLMEIRGLQLDGVPATPQLLIEIGPEDLFREVLLAVQSECGLSEPERKN